MMDIMYFHSAILRKKQYFPRKLQNFSSGGEGTTNFLSNGAPYGKKKIVIIFITN